MYNCIYEKLEVTKMRMILSKWKIKTLVLICGFFVYFIYKTATIDDIYLLGFGTDRKPVILKSFTDADKNGSEDAVIENIEKQIKGTIHGGFEYKSNWSNTLTDSTRGQFSVIDRYMKLKEYGYFLQIGTEGVSTQSLSLQLEKSRGWSGLVIEPRQERYEALRTEKRNSQFLQACITNGTSIWPNSKESRQVPCYHLQHILQAVHRSSIDLLLLDVDGNELIVLQSFPFEDIDVGIVCIEVDGVNINALDIVEHLRREGFKTAHIMTNHIFMRTDIISIKEKT